MKEETAYGLIKQLKAQGYPVSMRDAPSSRWAGKDAENNDEIAIVGAKGMPADAIKTCTDACRTAAIRSTDVYTIEQEGNERRRFPDTSFAAW